tara:strand:- start:31 stop:297 length:267 start_codon:yes stop_codon:yes gene_type:complete
MQVRRRSLRNYATTIEHNRYERDAHPLTHRPDDLVDVQDTWDAVASQVRLSSLLARQRELDEHIRRLQAEQRDICSDIERLRLGINDI